jgi:hypothetical protein
VPSLLPNSDLVAVQWLSTIPGGTADVVASQLPARKSEFSTNGAVVATVVSDPADPDLPIARPVVQIDFYAVTPSSGKPPWWKPSLLAEQVRLAVYDKPSHSRRLNLTAGGMQYPPARVISAVIRTGPRRIWADAADYARVQMDVSLTWVSYLPTASI